MTIINCNNRRKVNFFAMELATLDFDISTMHSDLDQLERDLFMHKPRPSSSCMLILINLLARYNDVQHILFANNFDLPPNMEIYC